MGERLWGKRGGGAVATRKKKRTLRRLAAEPSLLWEKIGRDPRRGNNLALCTSHAAVVAREKNQRGGGKGDEHDQIVKSDGSCGKIWEALLILPIIALVWKTIKDVHVRDADPFFLGGHEAAERGSLDKGGARAN